MQRANARTADWVACNIEIRTKPQSGWTVDDVGHSVVVNISDGVMKKTWSNLA
jgi:hypothetical protein